LKRLASLGGSEAPIVVAEKEREKKKKKKKKGLWNPTKKRK